MRFSVRLFTSLLPLLLLLPGAAMADTCKAFDGYTCAHGVHDGAYIGGSGSAIGAPGAGTLLNSNMFTVSDHNGEAGADVVIIAAFSSTISGSLNGKSFTSLNSFPEGGATGAIITNLQETGFCATTCNLSFGYVDLGEALPANGSITVTASGVPKGTAIYALVLNSKNQVILTTANSESGVFGGSSNTVPEPETISLMITGLCSIAGGALRKLRS
ncbi:MAG TPA: PEP-CTERM sorting domain-containing protein [Candidatus Binatia bacterium]|nr:PEP-CTERM sorting domain-containing protein [Candidatus Binatia bacterium]